MTWHREAVFYLWGFVWFRSVVAHVAGAPWSPPWLVNLLRRETPLAYGLHRLFTERGLHDMRQELESLMRRQGLPLPSRMPGGTGAGSAP